MKKIIFLFIWLIVPLICLLSGCDGSGIVTSSLSHLDHKGTEFILAFLPSHPEGDDPLLNLIIMSEVSSSVVIEYPVNNPTFTQTVQVSLSQYQIVQIPFTAATGWQELTPTNNAVRVTATDEVTVVLFNEKFALLDQALALPLDVLGQSYIVMSKPPTQPKGSEYIVVATQNSTSIGIEPNSGSPFQVLLNRGEGFLVTSDQDLSGSMINADKPVVVVNGNKCANVPEGTSYCEHLYEMAIPVHYWKTEILARNLPRALEGDGARKTYYQILASQDNTEIFLNGQSLGTYNAGFALELSRTGSQVANHFSANKPIFIVQYMNSICDEFSGHESCSDIGATVEPSAFGDPSMTNLVPIGQFHHVYSFYRVSGGAQPGYQWLNIIAATDDVQNGSVLLDGVPIDKSYFTAFSTKPEYSHASIPIIQSGLHSSHSAQGHSITIIYLGWHMAFTSPAGIQFGE